MKKTLKVIRADLATAKAAWITAKKAKKSADEIRPLFEAMTKLAMIVDDGRIRHVFYPVFPPDRNAADVLAWLKENPV